MEVTIITLDYSIKDVEGRKALVQQIIDSSPSLTNSYLEKLSDYILDAAVDHRSKTVLTDNRLITINKRETSYEGLVTRLEGSEDLAHNFINPDTTQYLTMRQSITDEDLREVPGLLELRQQIKALERQRATAYGKRLHSLNKQLIEMRQQQYLLKGTYKQPVQLSKPLNNACGNEIYLDTEENIYFDERGNPKAPAGKISIFDPAHVHTILKDYDKITRQARFDDFYYLAQEVYKYLELVLADKPTYAEIAHMKMVGHTNSEIHDRLLETLGVNYGPTYISNVWTTKIPKAIAAMASKDYVIWYYTEVEYGQWKRCSKCGETKLAHSLFFTRNAKCGDGFYSICKDCRAKARVAAKILAQNSETQAAALYQQTKSLNKLKNNEKEDR